MWKKVIIAGVVVVIGLFALSHTSFGNKVSGLAHLSWDKMSNCLENQVPPETEIERIRHELGKRGTEMKKHISVIAEEMVAVDNLKADIATTKANLEKQRTIIMTMKKDLEAVPAESSRNGKVVMITYGGRDYSAERVREKLARDWASYKTCEEGLKAKEKLLESKESALTTAREQLAEMRSQYEQVEVELAQLETEIKAVRLAQTRSKFQLDDSHLAQIKESKNRLADRVHALKKLTDLEGQFASDPEIRVDQKVKTADVLKEIDEHFSGTDNAVVDQK